MFCMPFFLYILCTMKRSERIHIFVEEICTWFPVHKRTLPWRDLSIKGDAQRAYLIMVSEIMLQQTQVERVKIVFKNFTEQFPTIEHLANASNGEVIMAWRGMGYNSRALRLRDAAKEVTQWKMESEKGTEVGFPVEMKDLQNLPGIGHYTAAAIRNFAFNIPTACLDTNIRRIYHRTFVGPENADGTWKKDDQYLLRIAQEALDTLSTLHSPFSTSAWHAALMDFGSLVCTKRSPKWDICPLTQKGIMKAAYKTPEWRVQNAKRKMQTKKEPGRLVGSTHIPNRIFRGKFVEELRDNPQGLALPDIGKRICVDWNEKEHMQWLKGIADKLKKDHLVSIKGTMIHLAK